jgi:transposase
MDARMPLGFYEISNKHFPEQCAPGRQGGRPPIKHAVVLKVIWYVEVTGCRWKDVPHEMGCCGETARTRLQAWEQEGIWDDIHQELLALLHKHGALDVGTVIIDSTIVRAFGGGDETGPNPVDRARPGTKFTLAVDRHGVSWRPNDTSDWRFKRYQLNQGSRCSSLACFCSPETPEGDHDGSSTEYGQVVIN